MITRLAGGFWDGNQPQPRGDQLSPDDPALGGMLPEDRRDWRLRTENGDGVEGKWMLLNGSFQSLKYQYVTNVAKCTVYFRKCTQCKRWIAVYSGTRLSCPGGCAAQRKKQMDAENRKRKQRIPGYGEKRDRAEEFNEWKKWAEEYSTDDARVELSGYVDELSTLWDRYYEDYEAASDPKEQERLGRTFKTEMRKIAGKAEDAYNNYKRLAIQPQK